MALNNKALQAKRAKKVAKRKEQVKAKTPAVSSSAQRWAVAASAPIHEALVWDSVFSEGIGHVMFSRQLNNGDIAVAAFILDIYCLGVKNAVYTIVPLAAYEHQREHLRNNLCDYRSEEPAYIRKLVEGAVAYAADLGFNAHADYKIAKLIFGDVDAASCTYTFDYGKDGKPFYFCGPNESIAQQRRIVNQLASKCGSDGYNFTILGGSQ